MKNLLSDLKLIFTYKNKTLIMNTILIIIMPLAASIYIFIDDGEIVGALQLFSLTTILFIIGLNFFSVVPRLSSIFYDYANVNANLDSRSVRKFNLRISNIFIIQAFVSVVLVAVSMYVDGSLSIMNAFIDLTAIFLFVYCLSYLLYINASCYKLLTYKEGIYNSSLIGGIFSVIFYLLFVYLDGAAVIYQVGCIIVLIVARIAIDIIFWKTFKSGYLDREKPSVSKFRITIVGEYSTDFVDDVYVEINQGINEVNCEFNFLILDAIKQGIVNTYNVFFKNESEQEFEKVVLVKNLECYKSITTNEYINLMFGDSVDDISKVNASSILKYLLKHDLDLLLVNDPSSPKLLEELRYINIGDKSLLFSTETT